jgi:ABC-type multidrug transport system fused ATPase/permease subunit
MKKYYLTILRLWKLLKPFHKHFYIQLAIVIFVQALLIAGTYVFAKVLNNIVDRNFLVAIQIVVLWLGIRLTHILIDHFTQKHEIKYLNNSIQQYLEEYSFVKIFNLNSFQYIEDHSAIKLEVINRGEKAIESIITILLLQFLPTITQVTFSLLAIAYFSVEIALLCLFLFMIATVWTNYFSNFHRPYIRHDTENWDQQKKIRTEAFQHLTLIKNFGVEDSYLQKYLQNRFVYTQHTVKTLFLRMNHGSKRWAFLTFGRFFSIIILIKEYSLNKILIGDLYAIYNWLNDVFSNIQNVIQVMRQIPLRFVELEKYLDIIDKKPEFEERGEENFEIGNIIFENVNFKYPKAEKAVIENLNITIPTGKKIAFVGFSGSGKSTITKLLLRIYDWQNGEIIIGNNLSLRKVDAQTLRQKIGYVEQHVDLFDISIKENILFGLEDKNISKEKIDEVVQKARITEFFHRLGDIGLDTIIGERGVKLSGGERQRIGIARALIKNPEVLIFDEATASLDTENEKYIQEAIDESSRGRTTIIIAHRLSTVQNADIIFVMDKGKIVGQGKHDELKENCEEYQRLIKAQEH